MFNRVSGSMLVASLRCGTVANYQSPWARNSRCASPGTADSLLEALSGVDQKMTRFMVHRSAVASLGTNAARVKVTPLLFYIRKESCNSNRCPGEHTNAEDTENY